MATISIPEPDTIALAGEVDLNDSAELKARFAPLLEGKPQRLYVDMSGVTYIDSSGLAVLIEIMQRLSPHGGALVLYGLQPTVQNVFHISRLDQVFSIYPDRAAAVSAANS